jgi:hypothetical protein
MRTCLFLLAVAVAWSLVTNGISQFPSWLSASVLLALFVVTTSLAFWRKGTTAGLGRPLLKAGFVAFNIALFGIFLSGAIEGPGGKIINSALGVVSLFLSLALALTFWAIDLYRQFRRPLDHLPKSWP